jgi:hypothetical protein
VRNWRSASSAKFAAKSAASHYIPQSSSLRACRGFRAALGCGLGVVRVFYQFEQRQIAQQGTAVKVALREDTTVLYHDI